MAFCSKCGATIAWVKTKLGKNMPIDYHSYSVGDQIYNKDKHVSHYATCKFANEFRKKGK